MLKVMRIRLRDDDLAADLDLILPSTRPSNSFISAEVTLSLCSNSLRQFASLDMMGTIFSLVGGDDQILIKSWYLFLRKTTPPPVLDRKSSNLLQTLPRV